MEEKTFLIKATNGDEFWTNEIEHVDTGIKFITRSKAGREFKTFLATSQIAQITEMAPSAG